MSTAYPAPGAPEPITFSYVDDANEPITGAEVVVRVRRADGLWYDWVAGTYGVRGVVVNLDEPMPEIDEPGTYEATWPGGAAGHYLAFVEAEGVVHATLAIHVGGLAAPGDEMTLTSSAVTAVQAGLATAAVLATAATEITTTRKYLGNRREVSTIEGESTDVTYDDDGVTPWRTHELRDGSGNAITLGAGVPARRGGPT